MDPAWIPLLALIAFVAATMSAVIGMGGGMLLLLAFYLVGMEPLIAIPLHGCVQLIANASRIWVYRAHARWRPILAFVLASAPLPVIGMWLFRVLPADAVKVVFGVLVLYATWAPPWGLRHLRPAPALALAGAVGGTFGVIVGASGPLIAPFLLHSRLAKEQLVATQAICSAWLHVIKIVAFSAIGFAVPAHAEVLLPLGAVVIVGAYAGRWVLRRTSDDRFRMAYRIVLTLLALRLVLRAWI